MQQTNGNDNDYSQVEVSPNDKIEDVARNLVANAPASAVYDGFEIRVEVGQSAEDVVRRYVSFRQSTDIKRRLGQFAISTVEIVAADSPGPGGTIDPWHWIKDPQVRQLYILWERRVDFTAGNTSVVIALPAQNTLDGRNGIALHLQHGPVVSALASLLVEHSFRIASSEARIEAIEAQLSALKRS